MCLQDKDEEHENEPKLPALNIYFSLSSQLLGVSGRQAKIDGSTRENIGYL